MHTFFPGGDDDDQAKENGDEPIVAGGQKHEYDLGDDVGEKIGEHEADEGNA